MDISDPGDGEKEWEIVHHAECPRVCAWWPGAAQSYAFCSSGGLSIGDEWHHNCYVQWEIDNNGIDSLDIYSLEGDTHLDASYVAVSGFEPDWQRLLPGSYRVQGWYDRGTSTPNGPAEPDGGLFLTPA